MNSKNTSASVRAKLLNIARSRNEIFTNLLIRYALEYVVMVLRVFLMPVVNAVEQEKTYNLAWQKEKGWEK
jgi:hypothetical protein